MASRLIYISVLSTFMIAGCTTNVYAPPNGSNTSQSTQTQPTTQATQTQTQSQQTQQGAIEKKFGFVKKIYIQNGIRYAEIDFAEMLTGSEAEKAAFQDGQCTKAEYAIPGGCTPNDYYIQNKDQKVDTLEISNNSTIEVASVDGITLLNDPNGGILMQPITFDKFKAFIDEKGPNMFKDSPYNFTVENKKVTKLQQQYLP